MKPTKQTFYLHKNGAMEGYFFTEEQLNQLLSDVIKDALDTAAEKVEINDYDEHEQYSPHIDTTSIKNTFEETYKQFEV